MTVLLCKAGSDAALHNNDNSTMHLFTVATRSTLPVALFVIATLALATPSHGQAPIAYSHTVQGSCANYGYVAAGYLNADDRLDLVNGCGPGGVTLQLGEDTANLFATTGTPLTADFGGPVVIADFNGDQDQDVLVVSGTGATSQALLFFAGNGDGTFAAGVRSGLTHLAGNQFDLQVDDLNGDGKLDAVASGSNENNTGNKTRVYFGAGDGTFTLHQDLNAASNGSVLADFDGDGDLDIAINGQGSAKMFLNGGGLDPTFTLSDTETAHSYGTRNRGIDAGFIDADDHLDLILSDDDGKVGIFLGDGAGGLSAKVDRATATSGEFTPTVLLLDLDADGKLDFLAGPGQNTGGNPPAPILTYSLGDGGVSEDDGAVTFADPAAATDAPGGRAQGVAIGKADSDDGLDVLLATNSGVMVFTSATAVRPSLDGNTAGVESPVVFGLGQTSASVTVTNLDAVDDLTISSFTVSAGSANPADFTIGTEDCTQAPIPAGDTCQVEILFSPGDAGARSADVVMVSSSPRSPSTIVVQGTGVLDFGDYDTAAQTLLDDNGARHSATGVLLGTTRDAESDATESADASSDDNTDSDDEDGVIFQLTEDLGPIAATKMAAPITGGVLLSASTTSLQVTMSGGTTGYLNAWLDYRDGATGGPDGVFDSATSEHVIKNYQLAAGTNSVPLVLPTFAGNTQSAMRFRITDASATTPSPVGLLSTGEVEDHAVLLRTSIPSFPVGGAGSGTVTLDGSGNVVITNSQGQVIASFPPGAVGTLVITGDDTGETVSIDEDIMGVAGLTVNVNLAGGFDTLVITRTTGTTTEVIHNFTGATDGSFSVPGGATVNYTGVDPIIDHLVVPVRTFNFLGAAETIVLNADGDGVAGNGYSFIDSELAESVSFANPTSRVEIFAGPGDDILQIGLLDTPLPLTFLRADVYGDDGANTTPANETFTVTPAAYPVNVFGEGESIPAGTCAGDGLRLDLTGGTSVNTFTNTAGTGSYTFDGSLQAVSFDDIESVGDAELSIAANYNTLYATQPLATTNSTELVITVTNAGAYDVNCATVDLSQALASWVTGGAVPSVGTLTSNTWYVDTIASGGTATLTITGLVTPAAPQNLTFTLGAVQDTSEDDNVATVALSFGFVMPVKAHVNSALYYDRGGDDALIVGLFQGSPGIAGAVWCKIEPTGAWPPAPLTAASIGDHWRPCSTGLPFPLHVNDLFEDASGTLWLASWGSAGLYKSEDDGETWTASDPIGQGHAIVYALEEDASAGILYASANNGLVLRSFNDGATWQQVTSLPGVAADTPWSLTAHPSVNGTVYAGTFGRGVYVTEDFGFNWSVLGGDTINDALLNTDATGDDFAGHVFDLEFSPDANYLFAGTGKGVWRANLIGGPTTFTGTWTQIGPTVTMDDLSVVTPEIRTLAFAVDGGGDDDLVAGSWGFGAFVWDVPNTVNTFAPLTLREGHVTFVAASPDGVIFVGTSEGAVHYLAASSATSTASEPQEAVLPQGYALGQNYPNPFNPVTTIGFALPETGRVRLSVFDGLGREIAVLVDGTVEAGQHEARFDAKALPSGTYLYRLQTEQGAIARTLVLMK